MYLYICIYIYVSNCMYKRICINFHRTSYTDTTSPVKYLPCHRMAWHGNSAFCLSLHIITSAFYRFLVFQLGDVRQCVKRITEFSFSVSLFPSFSIHSAPVS